MPRQVWRLLLLLCIPACAQERAGSLSGRIVFTSAGHGWTYHNANDRWYTQRGDNNELVEDYGNLDQMNMFVDYCFNAGATVVPFRPVGFQTNEVVLDNTSAAVQFSGAWIASAATSGYYHVSGSVPYQFIAVAATETATATYTPNISAAGFYPVYTWASHGTNRTSQLYRVRHTGGEAQVRVPHNMVGSGWIYLGNYYFNAGSHATNGAVVISNFRASPTAGGVVIADAIRFGNGMGDVVPISAGTGTPTISGYPREEECARYWVQRAIGVGGPESVYERSGDDGSDNVGAPPRMAAHMNREDVGSRYKRLFISFHSNAGGGAARGTLALHNGNHPGTSTSNQLELAQLIGQEVNDDLVALTVPPYELEWHDRGSAVTLSRSDIAFGEINNSVIDDEFDATILEVGFHDNVDDARLLRDPKVRNVAARATYQAVVRYMNEFDGVPVVFLPEPPNNLRAIGAGPGQVQLQWEVPSTGGGTASGYVVYASTNGYGFGPIGGVRGGGSVSVVASNLTSGQDWYFRVATTNAAGESLPSHIVGWRSRSEGQPPVLFVNGFDRFDRTLNVRQTAGPGIAGPNGGTATFDRIKPRLMNSFDYVVQHGKALSRSGVGFDSCENEAVANNLVRLTNYGAVIWAAGNESTADETFSATEQTRMADYLSRGGRLFVSGAEIAWDLDRDSGPSASDRAFLNNVLRADLGGDTNDAAGTYFFGPVVPGIFSGNSAARFDDGAAGIYNVSFPDRLTPVGSQPALVYSGGSRAAAVQYADASNGARLVYLAFPFETITSASARERYMFDVMRFFEVLPPPIIVTVSGELSGLTLSWSAITGARYRVQYQDVLGDGNWLDLPGEVVATGAIASKMDTTEAGQRFYRVLLLDL
jgi:hypothetical protein